MISWISAAFLVLGFVVLLRLLGTVEESGYAVALARRSFRVICSSALSDEAKEAALQKDAKELLRLFLVLTFGGTVALLIPVGLLWVCDRLEWVSLESVFSVAVSPVFLITSGALAVLAFYVPKSKKAEETGYSALDRCLHHVAFKTYAAQVSLADLEDHLFAGHLAACKVERPVFITALPRSGTTLLLECCAKLQEFASHCYRDMPFVLIPCLWSRFSATFQQKGRLRERAHGDGMLIDFDSPEALEEVLWKTFWRQHYRSDRIIPWQDEDEGEFSEFFRNHMLKIILLRRGQDAHEARYVSKNNLNIARTQMLRRLFPDSLIVVPFRQPLLHAASLLEQHLNFLRIQEEDPFAFKYMRAIGHHDFGKNLCPVDFEGWIDERQSQDTETLAFWLEYWVVSYRHLLTERDGLFLFSYEALCEDPKTGLHRLAEVIESKNRDALMSAVPAIRSPRAREVDTGSVSPSLLKESHCIYASLQEAALR
jgi:hypothetical protein